MFPDAFFIVDETPGEYAEPYVLTPELIRESRDTLIKTRGARRSSVVRIVLDAMLHLLESTVEGLDLDLVLPDYFASDKGRVALNTLRNNFGLPKQTTLNEAWAVVTIHLEELSEDGAEPLLPSRHELVQIRAHKGDKKTLKLSKNDALAWKTIDAIARIGTSLYSRRDGTKLHLILRSKVWHALSKLDHLVIMDGTAPVATIETLIGKPTKVLEYEVPDAADITRIMRPRRHLNRSELCPDGVAKVTDHLRGAVREDIDDITSRMPVGCSVVLCTYQPLAKLIDGTWKTGKGELADLLDPLHKHGVKLHVTYWGAKDVRGSNTHQKMHVSWGIGNPRIDIGAAGELAAALRGFKEPDEATTFQVVDDLAADAIAQFHERLRAIQRQGEKLLSLQSGEILPAIRWYRQNTTLVKSKVGRPKTVAAMGKDEFVAIKKAMEWTVREVAEALGITKAKVQRYLDGQGIPADVAERARAALVAVPESGVQKKKAAPISFTHFPVQEKHQVAAGLRNTPNQSAPAHEPYPEETGPRRVYPCETCGGSTNMFNECRECGATDAADIPTAERVTRFVPTKEWNDAFRQRVRAIRGQQAAAYNASVPPEPAS
jgi:transcriptional regulator with XRE-family HTH domain